MTNLIESISTTFSTPLPQSLSVSPPGKLRTKKTMIAFSKSIYVAIYLRVSDPSQVDGYSLAAQERLILEYCKKMGWIPVFVYREEGRTARYESISKRPVFQQLLEAVVLGKIDVVVVHTLDRWSRNLKVLLESLAILGKHGVGFVSITENIDYTTPHGKLTTQMLGGMAEFFSEMLAVHVKKGIGERALQGRHLGSLPFGYDYCWLENDGDRVLQCKPEHPGGIHIHPKEGPAVTELFRCYATGTTTLASLASRLNEQGFRTRNTKMLPDADGNLVAEPRLFTNASVRGILHNPVFTGKVRHKDKLLPGLHEPLVSEELFQLVQSTMRKNSGRSATLHTRPEREYLLKGLIKCAYCRMSMWAQTYNSGRRYYREHRGSRGAGNCVNSSGSITCEVPDEQIGKIMGAIILPESWMDRLLAKIQLADEVKRVNKERKKVEQQLIRLGQVYIDGLKGHEEYQRGKKRLEEKLFDLVVPGLDSVEEAGKLLENLPKLWRKASLSDRRRILMTMLDAVYVECKEEKRIVAIKPKPAFRPLFEIANTRSGSGVALIKEETPARGNTGAPEIPCSWWRRGRVELHLKRGIQVLLAA